MSDSCEVMKKFNRLMTEEINKLSGSECENTRKIYNHYCFLHVLINLGDDACANGLVDVDKCCFPNDVFNNLHSKASSTTYSAILLAARMFHQLGSEKYGRADIFEAFLKFSSDHDNQNTSGNQTTNLGQSRKGTQLLSKQSYFEREVGNRAHITFHNGNALWYHRNEVVQFIELHKADNTASEVMKTLENLLKMKVPLSRS